MTSYDKNGPMHDARSTEEAMKDAHGAANPGGTSKLAQEPSGVSEETPDAPLTNGGTPVPTTNQEAG